MGSRGGKGGKIAYRQEEVNHIHEYQHQIPHPRMPVPIRRVNQRARHNVVGKHLPVVLAALLNVDDDELLQPERQLRDHVPLHQARQLAVGPAGPQIVHAQVGGGVAVDVLNMSSN